ncbi:MAG: UDP-N-acetylmuramate dehydrogenase [Flavobacteriales bacterium]
MHYPVYLQLFGTENVYAVQGPSRFWECAQLGGQTLCHDVVATTWPERQRILDMVADDGPWERISQARFYASWQKATCGMSSSHEVALTVQEHVDLAPFTTFGISAKARWFVEVSSVEELREALSWARDRECELLVLGGGSNMLLHGDVDALVIHVRLCGVEVVTDDGRFVRVTAGAGEVWHDFVMHTLEQGWGGLENLSLIPGSVGASPMQNIGAYGVEIRDHFAWLDAVRIEDGALQRFTKDQCEFGYRESIFKRAERGKWILVQVAFDLDRQSPLRMGYGAIEQELQHLPEPERTHRDVSDAVIRIRRSKLPDPAEIGNAGSFFKNPTVPAEEAERLLAHHPSMPHYPQPSGEVKLAAGWLIEQAGWKGHRRGTHGVHDKQALVLVHFGGASGREVWALAQDIVNSVQEKFGVVLEPEVNQIGAAG